MENQSHTTSTRRQRGSRSGGRSRNRQSNQSQGQGGNPTGGSRNRSRNRNRRGSKPARAPQQTTFQKVLSILTFGLFGKPAAKSKPVVKREPAPERKTASVSRAATNAARDEAAAKSKRNRAEVTSGRLYVGNLDYSTGEAELESLFRGVGNVLSAEVVTNPRTQQSKGFAFVEMGSIEEARRAVAVLDEQDFMGRKLVVSGARAEAPEGEPSSN